MRLARRPLAASLALTAALGIAVWLAFPFDGFWRTVAFDLLELVGPGLAAVAAVSAARRAENRSTRRALLFLASAAVSWGLGQVVWTYYEVIERTEVPFPSLADVGYLAAVPLLAAAAVAWPRRKRRRGRSDLFDVILLAGAATLYSVEFVIGPLIGAGFGSFADWVGLAYPLGDLVILTIVAAGLVLEDWEDRERLVVATVGLVALVFADTSFALSGGNYVTGSLADVGWIVAFVVLGTAAVVPAESLMGVRRRVPDAVGVVILSVLLSAYLLWQVIEMWGVHTPREQAEWATIAILVSLLVARYWSVVRSRIREARRFRALAWVTDPVLDEPGGENALARTLLARVLAAVESDAGVLLLATRARPALHVAASAGIGDPFPSALGPEGSATARVAAARSSEVFVLPVVLADAAHASADRRTVRSVAAVPLVHAGSLVGVLHVVRSRAKAFSEADVAFLEVLAQRLAPHLVAASMQETLAQEYAFRDASLAASRTGLCLFEADGDARFWNSAFVDLLGFAPGEGEDWKAFFARLARGFGDRGSLRAHPFGEEFRFWSPRERYICVRLAPLPTGHVVISADDFTDQEKERQMRGRFVAEVVAAQEQQARRIAELLHDDAVQQLTALGLRLEVAGARSEDTSFADLAATTSGIVASLRRLLLELHPAVLESQGLVAAVEAAAETLRAHGVDVHVAPFELRLPAEVEQLAYRLVQEAFANVLKHAAASRAEVRFTVVDGGVRCQVSDDGRGFDPDVLADAVSRGHLGLHLVRERIELTGGRFLLSSRPAQGTSFMFEVPLPRPEHGQTMAREAAR